MAATLVSDINTTGAPSVPSEFVVSGGVAYFRATDAEHGTELWRTDGTPEGTTLVRDIQPGPVSSLPVYLVDAGGTLFFTAGDPYRIRAIWKTDGTEAGTQIVHEFTFGPGSTPGPHSLVAAGSKVFFTVTDATYGRELWITDGTSDGTHIVRDLTAGAGDSQLYNLVAGGNDIYFCYDRRAIPGDNSSAVVRTWWMSDGTETSTIDLGTPCPESQFGQRLPFALSNGTAYYATDSDGTFTLWKVQRTGETSPTAEIVKRVAPFGPRIRQLVDVAGTLFYGVADANSGVGALWKSNGTPSGTVLVKNLNLGTSIDTNNFVAVGNTLYFRAGDAVNGMELWKSDGTTAGTVLVKDLAPGAASSYPERLYPFDGRLFFALSQPDTGSELWTSDGTSGGTMLFKDIRPGAGSSNPGLEVDHLTGFATLNGRLLLNADDGMHGEELWTSDGTTAGTQLLVDVNAAATANANPRMLTSVGDRLFFLADNGALGLEPWVTDGTAGGTSLVSDIAPGVASSVVLASCGSRGTGIHFGICSMSYPGNWVASFADRFYFPATATTLPHQLWASDGTAGGSEQLSNFPAAYWAGRPEWFAQRSDGLYFWNDDGHRDIRLWRTDGTTIDLVSLKPLGVYGIQRNMMTVNDTLFFAASDGSFPLNTELWKSDGTEVGTQLVKEIQPNNSGTVASDPQQLVAVSNTLFFTAFNSTSGRELWKSDGTEAGTVLVKDIRPGSGSAEPLNLTPFGGRLVFSADDGVHGSELWVSDGTEAGTSLLADLVPGADSSWPWNLTRVGDWIYFTTPEGTTYRLWRTDGTPQGTEAIATLPGKRSALGDRPFAAVEDVLYFKHDGGVHGAELWQSDGTAAGTHLVQDLNPGTLPSNPQWLTNHHGTLYFTADDGAHGVELWKLSPDTPGDINGDGRTDLYDLAIVQQNFGIAGAGRSNGDMDGDQTISRNDVAMLAATMYRSPAGPLPSPGAAVASVGVRDMVHANATELLGHTAPETRLRSVASRRRLPIQSVDRALAQLGTGSSPREVQTVRATRLRSVRI